MQTRRINNSVAEELQRSLSRRGIYLNESVFEDRVDEIVDMIAEACDNTDEDGEERVTEEDRFYIASCATNVGGRRVSEGDYVEIEDTDEGQVATIYDADGNVREEGVEVEEGDPFYDDVDELEDDGEDVTYDDTDDYVEEEGVSKFRVSHGKKVKLSKNQLKAKKLRASGRLKPGFKLGADGKIVKMSAAERKARAKAGKRLAKKGKAARAKSLKKAAALNDCKKSGTVKEGFDINSSGMTITVDEGDEIYVQDGYATIMRDGSPIVTDLEVSESFFNNCLREGVIDEGDTCDYDEDEDVANEGAILTFKANKGYVLVREGYELPMGNRIRARATLLNEGYNVSSQMLDRASRGDAVVL